MPTIEELLDAATPRNAEPPTAEELRGELRDRQRRQSRLAGLCAGACAILVVVGVGFAINEGQDAQRIESAGEQRIADDQSAAQPASTERSPTERSPAETSPTTSPPTPAEPWFLAPAEPTGLEVIAVESGVWESAERDRVGDVVVTTDSASAEPVEAGMARLYHMDGVGIFDVGDPDTDYDEVEVDDRLVRVGEESDYGRFGALVASDSGTFVVKGVGLSQEQVVDLALAARLVGGNVDLGDRLPAGFDIVEPPSEPIDDETTVLWEFKRGRMFVSILPTTIEDIFTQEWVFDRVGWVPVRDRAGLHISTSDRPEGSLLMWPEDGHVVILGRYGQPDDTDPAPAVGLTELMIMAQSLERIGEPDLARRLGG